MFGGEGLLQSDLRRKIKLYFKYLMAQICGKFDLNIYIYNFIRLRTGSVVMSTNMCVLVGVLTNGKDNKLQQQCFYFKYHF